MAKTIRLSVNAWGKLKDKIAEDYGKSSVLISWRLRDQLGFTTREHTYYADSDGFLDRFTDIRLDFWDDQMQTMFLLKYSDFLNEELNEIF